MILGGNMTHQEPTGFPGVSDEIHSLRWIKNTKERTWGLRPTYVAGSKFPMYSLCWGMVINTIVVGYSRGLYIHSKEFLSKTIYLYEHVYIYIYWTRTFEPGTYNSFALRPSKPSKSCRKNGMDAKIYCEHHGIITFPDRWPRDLPFDSCALWPFKPLT